MKIFYIFLPFIYGLTFEKYRLTVHVQDRYVRSEVAVHVQNTETAASEYNFAVNLHETEFISSLTMRVGDNGKSQIIFWTSDPGRP